MVKDGERGIACGEVQVKTLGLGHMLIGDPTAEIEGRYIAQNIIKRLTRGKVGTKYLQDEEEAIGNTNHAQISFTSTQLSSRPRLGPYKPSFSMSEIKVPIGLQGPSHVRITLVLSGSFNVNSFIFENTLGGGFATGTIDIGGLQVCQISSFNKIWATHEGGLDNLGATFYEPSPVPEGYFMLGHYSQCNNKPLFGWVLAAKPNANDPTSLAMPTDYSLVWSSDSQQIKQDNIGYIWFPVAPDGYRAVGYVVTTSPEKPSSEIIRCVRSDLTEVIEIDRWIWGLKNEIDPNTLNVYGSRPKERGVQAMAISTGSFLVNGGSADMSLLYCLKNTKNTLLAMPNLSQIEALIQAYSPVIYFHPNEKYLPSSVNWYFQNGVLLYQKGLESKPSQVEPDGSNLPQGGSNDDSYWLDLPSMTQLKSESKKPMFGATFTDIAVWVFYPFNGPARVKLEVLSVPLGKIGEHIGDWEHLTLRVSNFDGSLKNVYFSEHSGGTLVDAPDLEFETGNKPVAYASLNGHAFYAKPGLVIQGNGGNGIRNDTAKGKAVMDTGVRAVVVAADHLTTVVAEPSWLNYSYKWGPKISYQVVKEMEKVKRVLPGRLKEAFEKVVKGIPNEVLGEEGPSGPKMKNNWNGDEKY
ncbi:hypothetical protein OSB04_008521 [Centaurea solstitialis]|uniref:Vacuolar protein sorting-associated protein 62 n=1 Tax=Centaurea solstitialis TaxID=347529 RepID=A0AA38WTX5_9ASTR|nr:hypothetical protein OSB04_008521 [Centaurea solstitialis]